MYAVCKCCIFKCECLNIYALLINTIGVILFYVSTYRLKIMQFNNYAVITQSSACVYLKLIVVFESKNYSKFCRLSILSEITNQNTFCVFSLNAIFMIRSKCCLNFFFIR